MDQEGRTRSTLPAPNFQVEKAMQLTAAEFKARINYGRLLSNVEALWSHERGQTIEAHHASARLAEKLLRDAGLADVERIPFPADGETVYQDKTSPRAWTATVGQLELLSPVSGLEDPVIADFQRHPFHLIRGSVATPAEGIETQLVNEDDAFLGIDIRGKMVLLNPESRPAFSKYREFSELGALGVVSDNLPSRYISPHGIQWVTGFNEGPSWHPRADTRPMIGFSISPITGDRLREAMRSSSLPIRVKSDGRLFADTVDVVTGVIPGESTTEIWLMAHLYEPLPDDNSTGVAAAVEIARVIQEIYHAQGVTPRHTLRLVFGHEMYGFAAYAARRGEFLGDEVLCALNLDALPVIKGFPYRLQLSQPGSVSCAEFALQRVVKESGFEEPRCSAILTENTYGDDMILADPTIGIATLWLRSGEGENSDPCKKRLWHSSEQSVERIDEEHFSNTVAIAGTWAALAQAADHDFVESLLSEAEAIAEGRLADERQRLDQLINKASGADAANCGAMDGSRFNAYPAYRLELEQRKIRDFLRFGVGQRRVDRALALLQAAFDEMKWPALQPAGEGSQADAPAPCGAIAIAEKIVPTGRVVGFPYDIAAVPLEKRRPVLGSVSYGPLASVLSNTDGHRNLAELICRAEWENRKQFSGAEIEKVLSDILYLSRCGYIDLSYPVFADGRAIQHALESCGIQPGDCVFLHSGMSRLGPIDGGPGTVIRAFLDTLGAEGTLLMPAFTRSFSAFDGRPIRSRGFRPFNPKTTPIWTGSISAVFSKMPGVIRSPHPTHSVAGIGPQAEKCIGGHKETDPPTGSTSAFAHLSELDAKIVFLGADLSSCTYLHFLEDEADLPCLKPATCIIEDDDGLRRSVTVPKHLPGPRNFYKRPSEETKTFKTLFTRGLKVTTAPVGAGEMHVISARQLHEVGSGALQDDPELFM